MRMRWFLPATLLLALAVSAPAQGAQDAKDGIKHAKQAGMYVDPDVEPLMARAPIGSCANDPTLPDCPKAKAFKYDPLFYSVIPERTAMAAGFLDQCVIKVNAPPYKAAGYAQGDTQNYCSTKVSRNDVYLEIKKYDLGYQTWRLMNDRYYAWLPTGKFNYLSIRMPCASTATREWGVRITGYSILNGVWFAGTTSKNANLPCNYP